MSVFRSDPIKILTICLSIICSSNLYASEIELSIPPRWITLKPILISRVIQTKPKMKLSLTQAQSLGLFLNNLTTPTPELIHLQKVLPKTTVELLMAVYSRGLPLAEAEKMAAYLQTILDKFQFENVKQFDENTSHIIGREWQDIDYTGEGMTWQKQKQHYLSYGIVNFKSAKNLNKFFAVESKLPYFRKIYRPRIKIKGSNLDKDKTY